MTAHRVAVVAGDGVGVEVIAEARKALDALGIDLAWTELDWGCARFLELGELMPPDWEGVLRGHDAVLMGACGSPLVPDHVSLWGMTLPIRQRLDLWANVRPARLLPGVPTPLAGVGETEIDMLFLRENTEGEYAGVGGRTHGGLPLEVALETSVFTRTGVERIARYGFELAAGRRGILTSATKSNASRHGYVLWDEVIDEVAESFPGVRVERVLVDALAARAVRNPASLDVVVASNLFGDILSDLAAALAGGLGMAASGNLAPGATTLGVFEPVHGSAPDIAGEGIANPVGAIWSAALMLEHLGEERAARRLMAAVEYVCAGGPRTPDIGGHATTVEVGDAIARRVERKTSSR